MTLDQEDGGSIPLLSLISLIVHIRHICVGVEFLND